ncbi:uncharacterized protein [Panulirus ornatus]|uniref:uncharacterized protein n=1 Tax=Panulirus ornatus TaxID=150431 RepID=UPI003A87E497
MPHPRHSLRLLLLTLVLHNVWSGQTRDRRVFSAGFDPSYSSDQANHALKDFQAKDCEDNLSVENASVRCGSSGCRVRCNPGYHTSRHQRVTMLRCDHNTGQMKLGSQAWDKSHPICFPDCGRGGCQNGGRCVGPGMCQCVPGYTGDKCEVRNITSCPAPNLTVTDAHIFWTETQLHVNCNPGFAFLIGGKNITVHCRDGAWDLPPLPVLHCIPECNPPCLNGGTCIQNGACKCPRGFWGPVCQLQRCLFPTRGLNHTSLSGTLSRVKIECHQGYEMRSGGHLEVILCQEGKWVIPKKGLFQDNDLNCYPVCEPACRQGGECTAPGHCSYPTHQKDCSCQD